MITSTKIDRKKRPTKHKEKEKTDLGKKKKK